MIRKTLITIVGTVAMAAMIQTTQAAFVGATDNLADLVNNNNSIGIGDKVFSGFSDVASGLTSFLPGTVIVTATQVGNDYFLTWGGNISLVGAPGSSADLLLGYTVTALDGNIFAIDQNYTGHATPANAGQFLTVSETVTLPSSVTIIASSYLDQTVTSSDFTAVGAILTPSAPIVHVTKDIGLGTLNGGFITISQIVQSFDQTVPEPTTMVAGALLLLPFGASTVRMLRKNRKA